jgi:SecY interacting protein Syd
MSVKSVLVQVLERYLIAVSASPFGGLMEYDPDFPSPCQLGSPNELGMVRWRPAPIPAPPDFVALEQALGTSLHPDAREYYSSYFAGPVEAQAFGEVVLLSTAWNADDLTAHLSSLERHVAACSAEGCPVTIVIAQTDSDFFFGLANDTGAILLQEPGVPDCTVVAPSLEAFLSAFTWNRA